MPQKYYISIVFLKPVDKIAQSKYHFMYIFVKKTMKFFIFEINTTAWIDLFFHNIQNNVRQT